MDALFSLFDAVACVGEVLGRGGEKEEELATLVSTCESVSQSVRDFAGELAPEERNSIFHSNQVFPQLAKQLQQCDGVIAKYRRPANTQQIEDESRPMLSTIKRGILQSSRTLTEGLEVLSGKLGSFGTGLLRLPEDELSVIRQTSVELNRLVPQLNLAISVYTLRGQKRLATPSWGPSGRPGQAPRLEATPAGDAAAGIGNGGASASKSIAARAGAKNGALAITNNSAAADVRECALLKLQLVTDYPPARAIELPALSSQELRPLSANSSSSVDSGIGPATDGHVTRLVFGRQELLEKTPKSFTLPARPGEAVAGPQPVFRFVSRNVFLLDVPKAPPPLEQQDTLDMATLNFGGGASDDYGATLAWGADAGAGAGAVAVPPLASISGLSSNGLHLQDLGKTGWRWLPREQKVDVNPGDRVALLLASPPGSCEPAPPRDLNADEVQLIVGVELQKP